MVLGDIRRVELRQDGDLLNDVFDLVFGIFDVNDFDSNRLPRPPVDPEQHVNIIFSQCADLIDLTLCILCQSFRRLLRVSHNEVEEDIWLRTYAILSRVQSLWVHLATHIVTTPSCHGRNVKCRA